MLRFLFPRLTAEAARGTDLFRRVIAEARMPHWYTTGQVADTVDGRFAMLSTVAALVMVRLERDGDSGDSAAVALTERFVEAMAAEHRQMGVGDPTLGRTVRKLVGSLARRVELWREIIESSDWIKGASESVYARADSPREALLHTATHLRALWQRLESASFEAIAKGAIE
jgi:cytochrome b pre-mRNA-processing protein 3